MKAAIDIGTNTVLLLVAERSGNELNVIHEEQRIPRLGKGVDQERVLKPDSVERVIEAIKEYQAIIASDFPEVDEIIVTATSAVRDARNRSSFINWVKSETDLDVQLLSGKEEAEYTYRGAHSVLDIDDSKNDIIVIDIGGGSTEVIHGRQGKIIDAYSFDMGSVRYTERYLKHDPPFREEIIESEEAVVEELTKAKLRLKRNVKVIGVGGTLTSLAAIDKQVEQFNKEHINGHHMETKKLVSGIDVFALHTHEQILELNREVLNGREDIFLAGILILKQFLLTYKLDEIIVSMGGVRHGAILK